MAVWLSQWAAFVGFWLLFVGSFQPPELLAGAGAALLAATASHLVWAENLAHLSVRARSLGQAWRLPKYVAAGTWEILAVLARHLFTARKAPSIIRAVHYQATGDDPRTATLRALAIAYTTIAPNFVIIGVDQEHRYLLFHQIMRSGIPRMTQNLGARP